MCNLGVLVERINQDQVDSVLDDVACHRTPTCGQVCEVRAAFYPHSLWVESNVLKLIEMNKADKLFIWHEIDNVFPLVIELENVLEHDL